MEDKENYLEFISLEDYKEQRDTWFKVNNISREKVTLFYDFIISLHWLMKDTFLGHESYGSLFEYRNHFTWCWFRTIENFNKERIYFKEKGDHYDYFWYFFLSTFYNPNDDPETEKINGFIDGLFVSEKILTQSELKILIEIYKILDQNLKIQK